MTTPYVCPEPVLVNRSHLYINGFKKTVLAHRRAAHEFEHLRQVLCTRAVARHEQIGLVHDDDDFLPLKRERFSFECFSLRLSRVCLGKRSFL
jgi:hypothetical protein